ncbi:MAG: hypothetical protein IT424_00435 [Pirellulales bacterium]|nr:hypothetical protein [Pirellulales bacterium]
MDAVTITCEICGRLAFVHKVRYKYRAAGEPGRPAEAHVLVEVERDLECPRCGWRTQTEMAAEG